MTTACRFGGLTKHGRLAFAPGTVYGFEDPDAVPYFVAMGWAKETEDKPDIVIPIGELDISPFVIFGDGPNKANFVMPDRAAAAAAEINMTVGRALDIARAGEDPHDHSPIQEA